MMVDRDAERAMAMVTPQMMRIGVVGSADDLIPRLEGLVAAGARHLSFGPPLGPDPFDAIEVLGRQRAAPFRLTGDGDADASQASGHSPTIRRGVVATACVRRTRR